MTETVVQIDGMMCGMCETHIQDTIRKQFRVKKVSASHKKGEARILAEEAVDPEALREAIRQTGYVPGEVTSLPYEKKGLFHR